MNEPLGLPPLTPIQIRAEATQAIRAAEACTCGSGRLCAACAAHLLYLARHVLADSLDAAWAEAEAALPKHWRLAISPYYPSGWEAYAYDIRRTPSSGKGKHGSGACYGDTPAAALRALAANLRERGA